MKNTGLLFGSFNPIHIGHLALANYLLEYAPFDELWFIVSPQNPFKNENDLAPPHHRLEMARLAVREEPRFSVKDVEFHMPRPSYTINTLGKLSESSPSRKFSLIIGSDNLHTIKRWTGSADILAHFPLVVYPRPGFPVEKNTRLPSQNTKIFDPPLLDISSTFIREGIREGKQLRYFVPADVYDYIISNNLYYK
ncbi:MAG: nicotinate (nicotinamide) nucleotide adenylyltransferase [Marinilabiliaceae bacterium]